jgi:hypothetical protein
MRAATAAGGDDENVAIVLTPTPALRRQPYAIRALAGCAQNDRIVIRLEGLATDFDTLLRAGRDCPAASGPRTALQQEDERGPQGFRRAPSRLSSCTPRLRRTSVIRSPLPDRYAALPDERIPGNARMLRPSDIFWK